MPISDWVVAVGKQDVGERGVVFLQGLHKGPGGGGRVDIAFIDAPDKLAGLAQEEYECIVSKNGLRLLGLADTAEKTGERQ